VEKPVENVEKSFGFLVSITIIFCIMETDFPVDTTGKAHKKRRPKGVFFI